MMQQRAQSMLAMVMILSTLPLQALTPLTVAAMAYLAIH